MAKKNDNIESSTASFVSIMRSNDKDGLFNSEINVCAYPTGNMLLDYALAYNVDIYDNVTNTTKRVLEKGILSGSYNVFFGRSGTAKSTTIRQIAANIIRPFEHSIVYDNDAEQGSFLSRIMDITKLPRNDFDPSNPNARYIYRQGAVDCETIQKRIVDVYKEKKSNPEKYMYNTHHRDEFNNEIIQYCPTVFIVDSIPYLSTVLDVNVAKDSVKMEQQLSLMDAAKSAGEWKKMMKVVLPFMRECNIIIFGVTQVNKKIETNAFTHSEKDMRTMKQDEVMTGGDAVKYGAVNIIKTTSKPGDYTIENGDGFNGFNSVFTVIKSRTTNDGKTIPMIYDQNNGIDSLRSLISYSQSIGVVVGNRNSLKFADDETSTKFSMMHIYDDFKKKPELWNMIKKYIVPKLEEMPTVSMSSGMSEEDKEDLMSRLLDY
jgi:hypothetical protein